MGLSINKFRGRNIAPGWQLSEGKMSYKNASDDEYFAAVMKSLSNQSSKLAFEGYHFQIVRDLYQYADMNGFEVGWS